LIALSLTIWTILVPGSPTSGPSRSTEGIITEPNSIAVLYFDNMSADSQDEYLSDGITEDIITGLTRLGIFQVPSRTAVLQYKHRSVDMREMRADLKVSSVLEGSVRRIGNRVRITAQLFDTGTGFHIWAQTFDREFEYEGVFIILDEVTEKIITALQKNLSGQFRDLKLRRSTENVEAYDYYLRGRYNFYKYSRDENEKAIGLFENACALDPNFAEAYAGIADAMALAYHRYWDRRPETLEEAVRYARKALSINDEIAEAHAALGTAYLVRWYRGEDPGIVELAEKSLRRAIVLDPAYDRARLNLVRILNKRGDYDEAVLLLGGVTDEGLRGYVEFLLGDVYLARGIPDTALIHYGESLKWTEDSTGTLNKMGLTMQKLGRYDEALSCFQRAMESNPEHPTMLYNMGRTYLYMGDYVRADSAAGRALKILPDDADIHLLMAEILSAMGRREEALVWAERTIRSGEADIAQHHSSSPSMLNLTSALSRSFAVATAKGCILKASVHPVKNMTSGLSESLISFGSHAGLFSLGSSYGFFLAATRSLIFLCASGGP